MSFSVRIVDADDRSELYAEIEYGEELVAEVFAENGRMRVAFMDPGGTPLWIASGEELERALSQARQGLLKFGLLE